jgi:hypothetical protein
MDRDLLVNGYQNIIATIYSPKFYYERVRNFLKWFGAGQSVNADVNAHNILTFLRSIVRLGIFGKERRYYWELLTGSLLRRPKLFPAAVRFSIYGFHFRKIYENFSLT